MTPKTEVDPAVKLVELEQTSKAARAAEREARDEQVRLQRAVPEARERLQSAHATGRGVKDAEEAFEAAQEAAADGSTAAKIDGLAQRTRAADGEVQRHREQHLAELIEGIRPKAEAAVQAIHERAGELRDALDEYNAISSEIGRVARGIQWFTLHARVPAAPQVEKLRASLDAGRLSAIPLPMPRGPVEDPATEQARLQREHDEKVEGARRRQGARAA